jgi:hypothetical protein
VFVLVLFYAVVAIEEIEVNMTGIICNITYRMTNTQNNFNSFYGKENNLKSPNYAEVGLQNRDRSFLRGQYKYNPSNDYRQRLLENDESSLKRIRTSSAPEFDQL